jgi:hypothetical protein
MYRVPFEAEPNHFREESNENPAFMNPIFKGQLHSPPNCGRNPLTLVLTGPDYFGNLPTRLKPSGSQKVREKVNELFA